MKSKQRVVVSGLGVISSLGFNKDSFWKAIINGQSAISKVTSFDTKEYKCHNAGEIKNFNPDQFIPKRRIIFLGRASQLAIAASKLAISDACLDLKESKEKKLGVFVGTTMGEKPLEESINIWIKEGFDKVNKALIMRSAVNNISSNVAFHFKLPGLNILVPTACAAGNYAIGYAYDLINSGEIDIALAGGADSFSEVAFAGFQRIYAMAPEKCQPFDKNRKGMVLGEGSGMLVIESLDNAKSRNAKIYAEILGYGLSCDAFHITAASPLGIEKAIRKALKNSGIMPKDIDYISAHGTGTTTNDKAESLAVKSVFNGKTKTIPMSSIKSMLGHTMGAASAIEAITCCLVINEGILPPTINYETPDPECDIDCVPNKARKQKVNIVLNNSFAFGGNNACLVLTNWNN